MPRFKIDINHHSCVIPELRYASVKLLDVRSCRGSANIDFVVDCEVLDRLLIEAYQHRNIDCTNC